MKWQFLTKAVALNNSRGREGRWNEKPFKPSDSKYMIALKTKNTHDIAELIREWNPRVPFKEVKLGRVIESIEYDLKALKRLSIHTADLGAEVTIGGQVEPATKVLERIFLRMKGVVKITGTSKALHILLPDLLVPWDAAIRYAYGCGNKMPEQRYPLFHIRIRKEIDDLIESYQASHSYRDRDEVVRSLRDALYEGGAVPLTRLVDHYNWWKYTRGHEALW